MLSLELIRQKFKTYNKRNRFRRILTNPSLKVYYDAALYRNLIPNGELTEDIYLFPSGPSLAIAVEEDAASADDGVIALGNAGDATNAVYIEKALSDPDILDSLDEVFAENNWGIVCAFLNITAPAATAALFDMTDGNDGYCRLEVSATGLVTFKYKGSSEMDEVASGVHDIDVDNDLYVFITMDSGRLRVYFNQVEVLDETVAELDYDALSPVNFAIGGIYSFSTIDEVCSCELALLAMFNDGLSANEKARYDNHVAIFYPEADFLDGAIIPPSFVSNPSILGTAQVGQELSLSEFETAGTDVVASYEWYVASPPAAIAGATEDTFTPTEDELADELYCIVTLTNGAGEVTHQTASVGPVIAA